MHLAELKQKSSADLNDVARDLKIEGAANLRKQELIFAILQAQTEKNGAIMGEGVLETLPMLEKRGQPSMSVATMVRGIEAGIEAALGHARDVRIAEGALD